MSADGDRYQSRVLDKEDFSSVAPPAGRCSSVLKPATCSRHSGNRERTPRSSPIHRKHRQSERPAKTAPQLLRMAFSEKPSPPPSSHRAGVRDTSDPHSSPATAANRSGTAHLSTNRWLACSLPSVGVPWPHQPHSPGVKTVGTFLSGWNCRLPGLRMESTRRYSRMRRRR